MARHPKSLRVGGGGRFQKLKKALKKKGARNPGALAAFIGRKKFGAKKFARLAAAGRRRAGSALGIGWDEPSRVKPPNQPHQPVLKHGPSKRA